jgi:hypothetical protein
MYQGVDDVSCADEADVPMVKTSQIRMNESEKVISYRQRFDETCNTHSAYPKKERLFELRNTTATYYEEERTLS